MGLFAISSLLALTLLPLPTPARPVTPPVLDARQSSSASTRTGGDLAFNIAFSLGWPNTFRLLPTSCSICFEALLLALLGSFAWFATGRTVAQLIESFNRTLPSSCHEPRTRLSYSMQSCVSPSSPFPSDSPNSDSPPSSKWPRQHFLTPIQPTHLGGVRHTQRRPYPGTDSKSEGLEGSVVP
jgi:hypothetical protein